MSEEKKSEAVYRLAGEPARGAKDLRERDIELHADSPQRSHVDVRLALHEQANVKAMYDAWADLHREYSPTPVKTWSQLDSVERRAWFLARDAFVPFAE